MIKKRKYWVVKFISLYNSKIKKIALKNRRMRKKTLEIQLKATGMGIKKFMTATQTFIIGQRINLENPEDKSGKN